MFQRWLPNANCYLRSREEDYISALILSVGFGLAMAGTAACVLRPCDNLMSHIAAIAYPALMALMMAMAVTYYAGWGSWIRRRLRHALKVMALLCCIGACAPICLGSGMPELIGGSTMLFLCVFSTWACLKYDMFSSAGAGSTADPVWAIAFMIFSVIFVVDQLEYISWSIFIAQIALLLLGAIIYCVPYRQWTHAVWHIFMIASACAHYTIVWQHLT